MNISRGISVASAVLKEPFGQHGYNIDGRADEAGAFPRRFPSEPPHNIIQNYIGDNAMNAHTVRGDWDIVKGKLKKKYASLTDSDLRYVEGQEEELIGRLEKKTGAAREELERFLRDDIDSRQR
jgi:uncharacterized protein YjbJ (UPF0337 family)